MTSAPSPQAEFTPPVPEAPRTRVPLKFEEWAAGIMIGLLGLITFANVVVRYLTNFSFAFTEEFSVFLMVLIALIGGLERHGQERPPAHQLPGRRSSRLRSAARWWGWSRSS